jgi:hypothetical protein
MIYTSNMVVSTRACAFLFFLLCLNLATAADTQWQGRALQDYIDWLIDQDLSVLYSSDLVLPDYTVQVEPVHSDRREALRIAIEPYGLVLDDGPGNSVLVVPDISKRTGIAVTVVDSDTNMPVPQAMVRMNGEAAGLTDSNGDLAIGSVAPGRAAISVTADGFAVSESGAVNINAGQMMELRFSLDPDEPQLTEIIVSSSVYTLDYDPAGSHTFLDREMTTRLPDIGDDAVRAVHRMPGIASGGVSAKSNVRGGADNEQLFLFDGLRLYEPYHLKDFHSLSTIVDQNAIAGIDFYSAGYQARYGDRMSGVIDIAMREPTEDTTTELALSFFNASVLSMGRFGGSDKGDWLVTARRGNLDLVADAVNSDYGAPRYQDTVLHLGWQFGERTYLSGNWLFSYDKVSLAEIDASERATASYRNRVAWLKAETDWNSELSSTTILSATEVVNARIGSADVPDINSGNVDDARDFRAVALSQAWDWEYSDAWLFKAGFDLKRLEAEYRYESTLTINSPFDQILDNQPLTLRSIRANPRGAQYATFVESRWRPFNKLILDGGIRWDQQTYTTADNDDQTSLRFNLLYFLNDRTELRFAAGSYYQAQEINELQVADGVETFSPAQRATHAIVGLSHELKSGIAVRLELYQKKYRSLMPRFENIFDPLVLIPELQIDRARIDANGALAKGAELMITGASNDEKLLWWFSYTWSVIEDELAGGNIRRSWDQTDTFKAGINWDWKKWNFSAAGTVHSGWPKTLLNIDTVTNPDSTTDLVASTTPRNSLSYATFHTIDARASRRFDVARGDLTVFLEVTNIYNRENACCTKYRVQTNGAGNQTLSANQGNWLPLIPSLGIIWQF